MKTMQQVAQDALHCQNACNLSGVVKTFADATTVLWTEAQRLAAGTRWVNEHPVSILFATQVAYLAGISYADQELYHAAFVECERLAKGGE